MQDRFKVRLYCPVTNRMIYDLSLIYKILETCARQFSNYPSVEDYNFLFSIGAEDKNGKLIYEGDVLEETYYSSDTNTYETWQYLVKWDDKSFAYGLWDFELGKFDSYFSDFEFISEDNEIVGNIFENKDLFAGEL